MLAPLGGRIVATLTITNTDLPAPTVSHTVQLVYAPHTRRVTAFRLQFSQPMDPTSAQTLSNYEVLLPPAHKNGPVRVVALSHAVLDPSGLFVTLYRASLGQHLTKLFQIVVRGKPSTGLIGTNGTFLAGKGGVAGTDATLTVSTRRGVLGRPPVCQRRSRPGLPGGLLARHNRKSWRKPGHRLWPLWGLRSCRAGECPLR